MALPAHVWHPADLDVVLNNWSNSESPPAGLTYVPEPASTMLLTLAASLWLRRGANR